MMNYDKAKIAEESLIGGLLLAPYEILKLQNIINESDFLFEEFKEIFTITRRIVSESIRDYRQLTHEEFIHAFKKEVVNFITRKVAFALIEKCISTTNLESWASIVKELSVQRQLKIIKSYATEYKYENNERLVNYFDCWAEIFRRKSGEIDSAYIYELSVEIVNGLFEFNKKHLLKEEE